MTFLKIAWMDFTIQLVQLSVDIVKIIYLVTNRTDTVLEIVLGILSRLSVKVS